MEPIPTFHSQPSFVDLSSSETLYDKIKVLVDAPWGMNTNFQAVFNLILKTITENNVRVDDIPQRLFVLSDMQFDEAGRTGRTTNFDFIRSKFESRGLTMPQLIFWNINGRASDFPVTLHESGTLLISGFSPSILQYIFELEEMTPLSIVRHILTSPRYQKVRDTLV